MNERKNGRMSDDAYAGFLKLWLTPGSRMPAPSPELDAYLKYANERAPLPALVRPAARRAPRRAA